ncbi:MAG TPA: STAS domain-containing protein [bacterium]
MLIITRVSDTPLVLRVSGDVDITNAGHFVDRILEHAEDAAALTLDLSEMTYFDSTGIAALSRLKHRFGDGLTIIPSPIVRRALEIVGLGDRFLSKR